MLIFANFGARGFGIAGNRVRHGKARAFVKLSFLMLRRLIAAGVVAFVLLLAISVLSGAWELLPVLSGSMSPGMPTGSIAIAQREPIGDLQLHDIAVFHPPSSPRVIYMHRVIQLKHASGQVLVRTKGDANPVPDPWTLHITSRSIYLVRYRIPVVGYVVLWVHSKVGREIILTAAGLLALTLVISSFWDSKRVRRSDGTNTDDSLAPIESVDEGSIVIDLRDGDDHQVTIEILSTSETVSRSSEQRYSKWPGAGVEEVISECGIAHQLGH